MTVDPDCQTCDGDGYVDIVDGWGGVVGPAPCPVCDSDGYYDERDRLRETALPTEPEEAT